MIAMLNNQMFYRTVEGLVMIAMLNSQMFYRTEEIGNDCNVKQSDVLQNC